MARNRLCARRFAATPSAPSTRLEIEFVTRTTSRRTFEMPAIRLWSSMTKGSRAASWAWVSSSAETTATSSATSWYKIRSPGPASGEAAFSSFSASSPRATNAGWRGTLSRERGSVGLTANVKITHTYRGDLKVTLLKDGAEKKVLSNNEGGGADNLDVTVTLSPSEVGTANGRWQVKVVDNAAEDTGKVDSVKLTFQ